MFFTTYKDREFAGISQIIMHRCARWSFLSTIEHTDIALVASGGLQPCLVVACFDDRAHILEF